MATSNTKLIHEGIKMNYSNNDMTMLGNEYWQKKNFLDHLDVNRKLAAANSMRRIEGILHRMYEDLRFYEPQRFMGTPFFRYLNLELFPKDLIEVVEYISSLAELDTNSVLLATLGSIASAMCGRYAVQVDEGWKEAGCLYTVISAPSGSRKSAVMSNLAKPFEHHFEELNIEFEEPSAAYEEMQEHLTLLKKKLLTASVNNHMNNYFETGIYSGNPKEALGELKELADVLDRDANLAKPRFRSAPQIFSSTGSKVSIGDNMSRQGEYTCIHEAEGGFFEGEVAFKSGHPDLFLKAYDMENYDYKSGRVGKIAMRRPAMCITAFVQPEVLQKWYQNTKLRGRGMIQRFLVLFAYKPIWGPQNMCLPTPPKAGSLLAYNSKISEMLKRNFTQDKNREIRPVTVTPDAYAYVKDVEKCIKQYIDSGMYLPMQSFLSKAHGSLVRLALCIHAWNNPTPEDCPITLEEMVAAASLMGVIFEHAQTAFAPEHAQTCSDASEILTWIYRCDWTGRRGFSDADVRTAISGLTKKQCHAALDLLEQHNYIRQYLEAGIDRLCMLNPRLVEQNYPPQNVLPVHF
jgi:hypothetical protein